MTKQSENIKASGGETPYHSNLTSSDSGSDAESEEDTVKVSELCLV